MSATTNSYVINAPLNAPLNAPQMHAYNNRNQSQTSIQTGSGSNLQPGFTTPSPPSEHQHQGGYRHHSYCPVASPATSSTGPYYLASNSSLSPRGYPPSADTCGLSSAHGTGSPGVGSGLKRPSSATGRHSIDQNEVSKKLVLPGIQSLLTPITPPSRVQQSSPDDQAFRYNGPSLFPVTPLQSPNINTLVRTPLNLPSIRTLDKTTPSEKIFSEMNAERNSRGAVDELQTAAELAVQQLPKMVVDAQTNSGAPPASSVTPNAPASAGLDYYSQPTPSPAGANYTRPHGYASPYQIQQQQQQQQQHQQQQQQQLQQSTYAYNIHPYGNYYGYYHGKTAYPHPTDSPPVAVGPQEMHEPAPHIGMGIYTMNGGSPALLDGQIMNGGFPFRTGGPHQPIISASKDIKRRTKTGCLTCRKRRIKCDESHPTCKNCDKSKRVCLGYDPIFRAVTDKRRRKSSSESCSGRISKNTMGMNTPLASPRKIKNEPSSGSSSPIDQESNSSSPEEGKNRMRIDSLLAAAASLEEDWTWLKLYNTYSDNVGGVLDNILGCHRFRQIVPLLSGKKKVSASSVQKKLTSGEDLAVLEVIRQIIVILRPNWSLDALCVDETSVVKLEELRITDDYKVLRCVAQLLTSHVNTEYLSVGESKSDCKVYERTMILHKLIYGVAAQQVGSPHKMTLVLAQEYNYKIDQRLDDDLIGKMMECKSSDYAWRILELLSRDERLTEEQLDRISTGVISLSCFWQPRQCDSPSSTSSENATDSAFKNMRTPILIGLLYTATKFGMGGAQQRLRGLLEQSEGNDWFNQRLIQLVFSR